METAEYAIMAEIEDGHGWYAGLRSMVRGRPLLRPAASYRSRGTDAWVGIRATAMQAERARALHPILRERQPEESACLS